jgi:hypothetical protein
MRVRRAYGPILGERYLEVRYEALCTDFAATARRAGVRAHPSRNRRSIGSARSFNARRSASTGERPREPCAVVAIAKPALPEFGYLERDLERPRASVRHSRLVDDFIDRRRSKR